MAPWQADFPALSLKCRERLGLILRLRHPVPRFRKLALHLHRCRCGRPKGCVNFSRYSLGLYRSPRLWGVPCWRESMATIQGFASNSFVFEAKIG